MGTTGGGFRADVQGLRAVAVIAVVLYHVDRPLPGGFVGVDVFFVISGFVIAGSLLRRSEAAGRVSMGDFFRRRAIRILPALVVFLLGSFPFVLFGPASTVEAASRTAGAALGFVANLQLVAIDDAGYFSAEAELNPYLHLWSLSVEEQFYLGFPLLMAFGLWRCRRGSRRPLTRLVAVAMAGSFLLMTATIGIGRLDAAFFLAPTRAWQFLAGALLAVTTTTWARGTVSASALRIGGLAAIAITMVGAPAGAWPGPLTVVTTAGAVAVIAAGADLGIGRGLLTSRSMVFIGALSYSWYLWHWPLVVTAKVNAPGIGWLDDVAAVLALVPAWLSWRYVEEPLRRASPPPMRPLALRSAGALAGTAFLALIVLPAIGDRLPGNRDEVEMAASVEGIVALDACPSGAPGPESSLARCGTVGDPARTAVLVGDSFAGQVADPFTTAALAAQWNPVIRTRTDCAFIPGIVVYEGGVSDAACGEHVDAAWDYLRSERPAIVVVSNRLAVSLTEADTSVASSASGDRPTEDPAQRRVLVRAAYAQMVETMRDQGTEVVLLRGTPETEVFALTTCARLRWVLDESDCGRSTTLDQALGRRAEADSIIDEIGAAYGLTVLDFDDEVCADGCAAHRDSGWVYADHGHITAQFARTLEPIFLSLFSDGDQFDRPPADQPGSVPGPETPQPSSAGPGPDAPRPAAPATPTTLVPEEPRGPELPLPPTTPPTIPELPLPDVSIPGDDLEASTLVPSDR